MDSIRSAVRYPFESEHGYVPLGKLVVLWLLSTFVIPWFTALGYALRLRETAIRGEPAPPLDEYVDLTIEGVLGYLTLLPLSILFFMLLFPPILIVVLVDSLAISLIGYAFIFAISIVFTVLVPAFWNSYALHRDFKRVYSLETLNIITTKEYIKGVGVYFLLSILIAVATFILVISLIGIIFLPVAFPLAFIIRHSFWGYIGHQVEDARERKQEYEKACSST